MRTLARACTTRSDIVVAGDGAGARAREQPRGQGEKLQDRYLCRESFFFTTRCELDKMCLIVQNLYVKRRFRAGMGVRGAAMFNFALCGWQSSGFAPSYTA